MGTVHARTCLCPPAHVHSPHPVSGRFRRPSVCDLYVMDLLKKTMAKNDIYLKLFTFV